jgi:hypothetical protein
MLVLVLGKTWLQRARTTYVGLLGTVVAIGLAISGFAVQLGWPELSPSPIPGPPPEDKVAIAGAPGRAAVTAPRGGYVAGPGMNARRGGTGRRAAARGAPSERAASGIGPASGDGVSAASPVAGPVSPTRRSSPPAPTEPSADREEGAGPTEPKDKDAGRAGRPAPRGPHAATTASSGKGNAWGRSREHDFAGKGKGAPTAAPVAPQAPPATAAAEGEESGGYGRENGCGHDRGARPHGKEGK